MKAKDNSDADKRVAKRMEADEDAGDAHRAAEEKASILPSFPPRSFTRFLLRACSF